MGAVLVCDFYDDVFFFTESWNIEIVFQICSDQPQASLAPNGFARGSFVLFYPFLVSIDRQCLRYEQLSTTLSKLDLH